MEFDRKGRVKTIRGRNPDDVLRAHAAAQGQANEWLGLHRSPWVSGSFYLTLFIVILAALLVVARLVPLLVLPVIVVGGLLAVSVVGAFQMRQDGSLGEQSFLRLMTATLTQLPSVLTRRKR
ncbi:hypothetical protein [Saccharopolyspora shandongensis]|uniref:hypothetical protein n=1 Tax=Saccharopolyspora shandongensis TaxID=418495 RepID=UPI00115F91C4|nr:hypothetical protein [Saccharopolyspora shandongensis]